MNSLWLQAPRRLPQQDLHRKSFEHRSRVLFAWRKEIVDVEPGLAGAKPNRGVGDGNE